MTNHVVTHNIVLSLPTEMQGQNFASCTQRWDAEGALARDFLPVLKEWLLARDEKHAAFSLDHVFSHILMVNADRALCDAIEKQFSEYIDKISTVEEKTFPYIPATAKNCNTALQTTMSA